MIFGTGIDIVDISHSARAEGAGIDTGRLQAFTETVVAESAFVGDLEHRVEKAGCVWTGHNAIAAADAPFSINQDYSVIGLIGRTDRAHLGARRSRAVITELWYEKGLPDVFRINFLELTLAEVNAGFGESIERTFGAVNVPAVIFGVHIAFHPCTGDVGFQGNIVFSLARFDTETAANTLVGIHQKSPLDIGICSKHLPGINERQC